jgi:hypothetical protein
VTLTHLLQAVLGDLKQASQVKSTGSSKGSVQL